MKIVIDAGHGYDTPGKRCPDDSMREYQFNREVAAHVCHGLIEYVGVEVLCTHSDERDVPLNERTHTANAWHADLFVSIHANAFGAGGWDPAKGIETFAYTLASAQSMKVAKAVHAEMIARTGLLDRGVKRANYAVLRQTDAPAILVECGFMTNKDEAALLKSPEYRRTCAAAIIAGIVSCYGLKTKLAAVPEKPTEVVKPQPAPVDPMAAVPVYAKEPIEAAMAKGVISNPQGSEDFYRFVTILHRLGHFE